MSMPIKPDSAQQPSSQRGTDSTFVQKLTSRLFGSSTAGKVSGVRDSTGAIRQYQPGSSAKPKK
jgi:hypothetical protein